MRTYILARSHKDTKFSNLKLLFKTCSGLFPLLANAAMNVKPMLLNIYETHFVPLGERLRPGMRITNWGFLAIIFLFELQKSVIDEVHLFISLYFDRIGQIFNSERSDYYFFISF